MNTISRWALVLTCALPLTVLAQSTAPPVVQRGYDANVSGANLTESTLNTSNVEPLTFGQLFDLPVDERIFAQPLYVPNVAIQGQGSHNVLYVATMNDSVYAFDADSGGAPLWSVNLASLFGTTAPIWANFAFAPNNNQVGHLGIVSTPVIDLTTNVMYVVACTLENSTLAYRLHAIDITSGTEPYGPGVLITASYSGIMLGTPYLIQRMSLVLADDQVVFGFSGLQSEQPQNYVGWVLAYDKRTLQQSGVFAAETTGNLQGGVWQSGRPPAVDASGDVYVFTGNTKLGGWNGVTDFSESALKLDPSHGLALVDWFTAGNWQYLDDNDLDLSSSGPLLIPGKNLLAGGGKTGDLYVLNTTNLGHWNANDSQVVQKINISGGLEIQGGPVYWEGSAATGGALIYDWADGDVLKAYAFNGSTLAAGPSAQSTYIANQPGGFLALSANGTETGSAVLWANAPGNSAASPPTKATLHAFNAENITQELWNSQMNAARDSYGYFATNVPPLIVNGKVYMATASNQVAVYGLLSSYTTSPTSLAFGNQLTNVVSAPQNVTLTNTGTVALPITSISLSTNGSQPFSQTNTCETSVAVGGSCTISVVFNPASVGPAMATLSVTTGNGAGTQTVPLSGTGIVPMYTASPTSLEFGNQVTNAASAPQNVTITNAGTVALPITSITVSNTGSQPFALTTTCGTAVAVAGSCTITVVFDPSSVGPAAGTLTVIAGGGAGTRIVPLAGTGTAPIGIVPTYTASPNAVAFGNQVTNVASAARSVTVTNTGSVALPITAISLSSAGSQPFSQSNTCGTSVAVAGACSIALVFNPASEGAATATLSISAGGGAAGTTVALSGTGITPSVTLMAAPTSVTVGNTVILTWTSSNATSCAASGGQSGDGWAGAKSVSGTANAVPSAAGPVTYTMTCESGPESVQAVATITVTSAPSSGSGTTSSSGGGGGGALDVITLLSLLMMTASRSRRAQTRGDAR